MPLPADVTTCTVTYGKALGPLGSEASIDATLTMDRKIIHAATGWSINPVTERIAPAGPGQELVFQVPHVDQDGMIDASGAGVKNWKYILTGNIRFQGQTLSFKKEFQVFVGQESIDLDLIPDGAAIPGTTTTSKWVKDAQDAADEAGVAAAAADASADAAAASATEAAAAKTSAEAAATTAQQAATTAATAATAAVQADLADDVTAAQTARTGAEAAAGAAQTARTGAETARTAAETAATNAAGSASSASGSATTATTKAGEAQAAATAAADSATAAETARTGAETARDDAAASETAAQGYAQQAAGSVSLVAWAPATVYAAGDVRQAPDGSTVRRVANGTSGASFDAAEEAAWESPLADPTTVAGKGLSATIGTEIETPGTPANTALLASTADSIEPGETDPRAAVDARAAAKVAPVSDQVTRISGGLYLPTRMAGRKWRTRRAQVLAGLARGHVAVLGDSIAFGAAATGTTPPKNQTSWPGRLRAILEQQGRWGGGWVICNADVFNNPTWDTRWTFGPGVTAPTGTGASGSFGFHRSATYLIPAGGYVEFTDTMDKVQILTGQGSSGLYTVKIDGVSAGTAGNGAGVGTIAKVTDTDATAYAPSQEVTTEIDCGTLGSHTVRIEAPAESATYLLAIKPIVSGLGKIEVSNASISGKSLYSLWSASAAHNDETNGLYGLPMIDFLKADLLVCALGINDWQFPRTLAATQADLATLLARQTGSGNAPTGAVKANGDAILLWNPQPDTSTLGLTSPDSWTAWHGGWYDSADAAGVPLLDLGERWIDYATGNAAGLFADKIHPNDAGSLDIVSVANEAIMHGL